MKYRDDIEHDYDLPSWLWWLLGAAMLAVIALISTAQGQSPFDIVYLEDIGDSVQIINTLDWMDMDTSWRDVVANGIDYTYEDSTGRLYQREDYVVIDSVIYKRQEYRWWWGTEQSEYYIHEWRISYWGASWRE